MSVTTTSVSPPPSKLVTPGSDVHSQRLVVSKIPLKSRGKPSTHLGSDPQPAALHSLSTALEGLALREVLREFTAAGAEAERLLQPSEHFFVVAEFDSFGFSFHCSPVCTFHMLITKKSHLGSCPSRRPTCGHVLKVLTCTPRSPSCPAC